MRVLVLNGSPKKKSDTFRLTERFLKGLSRPNRFSADKKHPPAGDASDAGQKWMDIV